MTGNNDSGLRQDLKLATDVLVGDEVALERFLVRLECLPAMVRDRARKIGLRLTEGEVEEIVQNVFVVSWSKLSTYDGTAKLETWAYGIVVFEVLRARAQRFRASRSLDLDEGNHPVARDLSSNVDGQAVHLALNELGPPGDEIVRLKHFEGLTFNEISQRLAMPAKTVMSKYYRVLDRLRVILRTDTEEENRHG